MDKLQVLEKVFIYDRMLRFNIDLLTGIKMEIKADVEETKIIGESLLGEGELKLMGKFLNKVEGEFLRELENVLEEIYDEYEVFNFDITFLSNLPEEVGRDIERLELVSNINSRLKFLSELLSGACFLSDTNRKMEVIFTPFRVYCELINHAIEFNKKFENI